MNPIFENPFVSKLKTLTRYHQIFRFLHVANNYIETDDPLHKVRPLLDLLMIQCKRNWNLSQEVSIDEMDVGFQGLHRNKVCFYFHFFLSFSFFSHMTCS